MPRYYYGREPGPQRVVAQPVVRQSRRDDRFMPDEDIEVIDLDRGRREIKPTTWY